jgi:hypothetical protein
MMEMDDLDLSGAVPRTIHVGLVDVGQPSKDKSPDAEGANKKSRTFFIREHQDNFGDYHEARLIKLQKIVSLQRDFWSTIKSNGDARKS